MDKSHLEKIMDAIQALEDLGVPDVEKYIEVLEWIEAEVRDRLKSARSQQLKAAMIKALLST